MELTAGSIAVFSSLSPHRTGPNLTQKTRKAYILQYADDGAVIRHPRIEECMLYESSELNLAPFDVARDSKKQLSSPRLTP